MSETEWTREQREAIVENGCNLLVTAAAGAGKTAVLVERIIGKITGSWNAAAAGARSNAGTDPADPVDIDRLLIVTFTNSAATEMKERINDAIAKALDRSPGSRQLQKQLALLNKASITTIHSFCLDVIRNNFHRTDLDPDFRIADETESLLMKMESAEELLDEKYEEGNADEEYIRLVECYSGNRDDRALQDMVLTLYDFTRSHPWPEKWLQKSVEALNLPDGTDFGSTAWAKILLKYVRIELSGLQDMLRNAASIAHGAEGLSPYLAALEADIAGLDSLMQICNSCGDGAFSWDRLQKAFTVTDFASLSRCGKNADKLSQERVKYLRNEAKERFRKIRDEIFIFDSESAINDLKDMYPVIKRLSQLVIDFERKYASRKRERSLLDFNDLEHYCLEILTVNDNPGDQQDHGFTPSEVALGLRERFEEILVDEYQDSNLVQEVILNAISRKDSSRPNIFMVGDIKQSIYRFRQAKPELFLEKYNKYPAEHGFPERKISLLKNFRSRSEVIEAVNFVFKQLMSINAGELDYNEAEYLKQGREFGLPQEHHEIAGGAVEFHIIDASESEPGDGVTADGTSDAADEEPAYAGTRDEDDDERLDNIQLEARLIAGMIKKLVNPDTGRGASTPVIYDRKQDRYRMIEYRDIVVLMRSTRKCAEVFTGEFANSGIPAYADIGTGFFKSVEVQTVMSLLQIIDNPMQDIPMLAVLRSPIASFTPGELADIRLADRKASFYEAMKAFAAGYEGETAEKTRRFIDRLNIWRDKSIHMAVDELIWLLYSDTGYYSYTGAMPGGMQRQANLRILYERAGQYEETSYKGLFNFISFIDRLKSSSGDMGSAKILGENENVVKLMSIHKSKGLEFPVVIIARCGKKFNLTDMNRSMLLHQELGFGPDCIDYKRRISYPTLPKHAIKYKTRLETLSEEMRILYVGLTRAKERLIITGLTTSPGSLAAGWNSCSGVSGMKLPDYSVLKGKSYLDWIGSALARHRDGGPIRRIAGVDEPFEGMLPDNGSKWYIRLWTRKDIIDSGRKAEMEEAIDAGRRAAGMKDDMEADSEAVRDARREAAADAGGTVTGKAADVPQELLPELAEFLESTAKDAEFGKEIARRLEWEYKYRMSAKLPVKLSVTELKRRFDTPVSDEYVLPMEILTKPPVKRPAFLEETKGLTTIEKGIVLHSVMQHLDLKRCSSAGEIRTQIDGMLSEELLTLQQAEAIDIYRLSGFFKSPVAVRMLGANRVYREVPFNIELKSTEIFNGLPEDIYGSETVLLQGIIDCFFEEQGETVLLDYKTDFIPGGETGAIKDMYEKQILYYAKALEKMTGKRVKGKYIYLFWSGETLEY